MQLRGDLQGRPLTLEGIIPTVLYGLPAPVRVRITIPPIQLGTAMSVMLAVTAKDSAFASKIESPRAEKKGEEFLMLICLKDSTASLQR